MEWVSPCLWKLNLFLNCWKVRQTWRVTRRHGGNVWLTSVCQQPLVFENGCRASEVPSHCPRHLLGYDTVARGDANHSGPAERLDLGQRGEWRLPGPVDPSGKLGVCGAGWRAWWSALRSREDTCAEGRVHGFLVHQLLPTGCVMLAVSPNFSRLHLL